MNLRNLLNCVSSVQLSRSVRGGGFSNGKLYIIFYFIARVSTLNNKQ